MSVKTVSVVNLGLGNLHSVVGAVERVGAKARVVDDVAGVEAAEYLLVPGQGAFGDGARAVSGPLGEALRHRIVAGTPYLGICLGMQLLFESSEEAPEAKGLGILKGKCIRFEPSPDRKVPHMGWNTTRASHSFVEDGAYYYFVHSFHCVPDDSAVVAAETDYGEAFCSAVAEGNLYAVQFHPEKSQRRGETLLRKFLELTP
ncbi:MAG: imidazole glycerol phosphate synthase subunit HisH [Polyangiales bacterium]